MPRARIYASVIAVTGLLMTLMMTAACLDGPAGVSPVGELTSEQSVVPQPLPSSLYRVAVPGQLRSSNSFPTFKQVPAIPPADPDMEYYGSSWEPFSSGDCLKDHYHKWVSDHEPPGWSGTATLACCCGGDIPPPRCPEAYCEE
jgi:hypothetical protein